MLHSEYGWQKTDIHVWYLLATCKDKINMYDVTISVTYACVFCVISQITLHYSVLIYPDHLLELVTLCWFSLFWRHFDFNERGQICSFRPFSWEHMGGMACKFDMLIYPHRIQNWLDFGLVLLIFLICHVLLVALCLSDYRQFSNIRCNQS